MRASSQKKKKKKLRQWSSIFKVLRGKNPAKPKIIYPAKMSLKNQKQGVVPSKESTRWWKWNRKKKRTFCKFTCPSVDLYQLLDVPVSSCCKCTARSSGGS